MYKRILLTLDRSALAEQALPHAVTLARACQAELELVSVVPVLEREAMFDAGGNVDWDAQVRDFEEYLAGVASRIQEAGLSVRSEVRRGDIAEEILRHADEQQIDLIVMSTHGRSGLGRWVYGSIADRVLRFSPVPVLLIRTAEEQA